MLSPADESISHLCGFIKTYSAKLFADDGRGDPDNIKNVYDMFYLLLETEHMSQYAIGQAVATMSEFLAILSRCVLAFLDNENNAFQLCRIMQLFTECKLNNYLIPKVTELLISFLLSNFETFEFCRSLMPFISEYFSSPEHIQYFCSNKCIEILFSVLKRPNTNQITAEILSILGPKLKKYIEDPIEFAGLLADTLKSINTSNVATFMVFTQMFLIPQPTNAFYEFMRKDGFESINSLITSTSNLEVFSFYQQMVKVANKHKHNDKYIIVENLIHLISITDFKSEELVHYEFATLQKMLQVFKKEDGRPFNEEGFATLSAMTINRDDTLQIFFEICSTTFISKFVNPSFLVTILMKYSYTHFVLTQNSQLFLKLIIAISASGVDISQLLIGIFYNATIEEFAGIMERFPEASDAFALFFRPKAGGTHMSEMMQRFLVSGLDKTNFELFSKTIAQIFVIPTMPEVIVGAAVPLRGAVFGNVVRAFTEFARKDKRCRSRELRTGLIFLAKSAKPENEEERKTVLDLISALSGRRFDINFDKAVGELLESVNFYGATESELRKLAFGLEQKERLDIREKHLCFPSILGKCGFFAVDSQYDKWVCGAWGIEDWARQTNKEIWEFPCIETIAMRYVTTNAAMELLKRPKICRNSVGASLEQTPVFEFTKRFSGTNINIKVDFGKGPTKVCSFWIFIVDYPSSKEQAIFKFRSASITMERSMLLCNNVKACDISANRWYCIQVEEIEDTQITLYVNGSKAVETEGRPHDAIFAGGFDTYMNWYIGGVIRFFEFNGRPGLIDITRLGVKNTALISPFEIARFSAESFVSLDSISDKATPSAFAAISYPLQNYAITLCDGGRGLFKQLFDEIENTEESYNLAAFITVLHQKSQSALSNSEFGLLLSSVMHLSPDGKLMRADLIKEALVSFIQKGGAFDCDSAIQFLSDPGMLTSSIITEIAPTIRKYITRSDFKSPNNLQKIREVLMISLLHSSPENAALVLSLINDTQMESAEFFRWAPYLFESPIYNLYHNVAATYVDQKFDSVFALFEAPPKFGAQLALRYVLQFENCLPPFMENIGYLCVLLCNEVNAWSAIVSMLIGAPTDLSVNTDFEFGDIRTELLPSLMVMTAVLLAAQENLDDKFQQILHAILGLLKLVASDVVLNNMEFFGLMAMLSMGQFSEKMVVFPFAPYFKDIPQVHMFARKRGQQFCTGNDIYYTDFAEETIPDPEIRNSVISRLQSLLGKDESYEKLYQKTSEIANERVFKNIAEFITKMSQKFSTDGKFIEIETVDHNMQFLDAVQVVANVLVERVNLENFSKEVCMFALGTGMFKPEHSCVVLTKLIMAVLTECSAQNIYSADLFVFIVDRIFEGWLSSSYAPILSLLLLIVRNAGIPVPQPVLGLLILGFELVPSNQFHIFVELFVNYNDLILSPENVAKPNFVTLLLDRIIVHYSMLPESFDVVLQNLLHHVEGSEALQNAWQSPNMSFEELVGLIRVMTSNGFVNYNKWVGENQETAKEFDKLRLKTLEHFSITNSTRLNTSLEWMLQKRMEYTKLFAYSGRKYINDINMRTASSGVISAVLKEWAHEKEKRNLSLFLRRREAVLAKYFKAEFDEVETDPSPLNCPFYPNSRRVPKVSVPDQKVPIYSLGLLPESILSLLKPSETVLSNDPKRARLLAFSSSVEGISDESNSIINSEILFEKENYQSFQCFFFNGNERVPGRFYINNKKAVFVQTAPGFEEFGQKVVARRFGEFSLFEGMPAVIITSEEIINITSHPLPDCNGVVFNEISGYSLLIGFDESDIKTISALFLTFSPGIDRTSRAFYVLSPIQHAWAVSKMLQFVARLWVHGEVDSITYLFLLNHIAGRHSADPENYPFFPRLNIDGEERDMSKALKAPTAKDIMCGDTENDTELLPQKFLSEEYAIALEHANLEQWIDTTFGYKLQSTHEKREKIFKITHLMSDPSLLFWHSINTKGNTKVAKSKAVGILSDENLPKITVNINKIVGQTNKKELRRMFLSPTRAFIGCGIPLPPEFEERILIDRNGHSIIKVGPSVLAVLARGATLQSAQHLEVSADGNYYAISHSEPSVSFGRIIYKQRRVEGLEQIGRFRLNSHAHMLAICSPLHLIACLCESQVVVFDMSMRTKHFEFSVDFHPTVAAFDEYADHLVIGGYDRICIVELSRGLVVEERNVGKVESMALSHIPLAAGNRFIVCGMSDGRVLFLSLEDLRTLREIDTGLRESIRSVCVDPRGQRAGFATDTCEYIAGYFKSGAPALDNDLADRCAKCASKIEGKCISCRGCGRFFCGQCFTRFNKLGLLTKKEWVCADCLELR